MRERGNVFLAGVGGQGILLASEVMAEALLLCGYDVKKSEVHGMAQRGGAVTTHLRYGSKVFSPLIEPGTADLLLAFEKMEGLRYAHYLRERGVLLVNAQEIMPPSVLWGEEPYPPDAEKRLRAVTPNVFLVDALRVALSLHEARAVNMVMVGAASRFLPLPEERVVEVLRVLFSEAAAEVNARAFLAGRALLPAPRPAGA